MATNDKLREREPVLFNSVVADGLKTLVLALISLALAFEWIAWSDAQVAAVLAVAAAVFALISGANSVLTRDKVTPLTNPRDNTGRPLVAAP